MTNTQRQKNVPLLLALIREAARASSSLPPELLQLIGSAPLKVTKDKDRDRWIAEARFSEKKRAEQSKMTRAWERITATVKKKPWKRVEASSSGWNGQTDTGGNFSRDEITFKHKDGLSVKLSHHVSFSTGMKSWTIVAWR